jgi:hypothetical protein
MYSSCLFCSRALGRNEVVEAFPVGRRLAFDAAKGRLWVVCRSCERWNLTPLEERWEAIETCERLFRDTRVRVSTEHIGLAKLREGLELVRVGAPQRPEFAAWRYGDQFGRRRKRQFMLTGAATVAAGAVAVGWGLSGFGIGFGTIYMLRDVPRMLVKGNPDKVVAQLEVGAAEPLKVLRRDLESVKIVPGDAEHPIALRVTTGDRNNFLIEGARAMRAAGQLLPQVNRFGGTADEIDRAVRRIEHVGGSNAYLSHVTTDRAERRRKRTNWLGEEQELAPDLLGALSNSQRLAIEMAVHEEQERRALEGELAELERAWQNAEEIASIADNLLLPSSVETLLARFRSSVVPASSR